MRNSLGGKPSFSLPRVETEHPEATGRRPMIILVVVEV